MNAKELNDWLRSHVELPEKSVDRIVVGDPDTAIKKIGTCWMPYQKTLSRAYDDGVNVMVVHEPTFYTHWDLDANEIPYPEQVEKKTRWILDHGMVVIRCHDMLDKVPGFGIPTAFGNALGFMEDDLVRSETYYHVYRTIKRPARDVAAELLEKMADAGQPGGVFYGDPDRPVETVGVGTGCFCNPREVSHLEPDFHIAIDDSVRTWTETVFAEDTGLPLLLVHHGTTEEFGMRALSRVIADAFPSIETIHYRQGFGGQWLSA